MENNNSTRNIENEKLNIIIYDKYIEIKPKQKINKWINKWRDEWRDEEFESEFQKIKSEILKEQKPLYFVEFNFYEDLVLDSSIVTSFNFLRCNINSIRLKNHLNATHTFQECNINKVSAISCHILNGISFQKSIIKEADFSFAKFDKTVDFSIAEFKQNAIFHNTIFNGLTKFSGAKFTETAFFLGAKFENIANFIGTNFYGYAFFKNTKFQSKAYFSNAKFMSNAYFDNTKFVDYAEFYIAKFEAVACFYSATFEKSMNFSSVVFKDFNKINFVNLNIEKIDMESIKDSIEENYKDESYEKEKEYKDDKNEIEKLDLKYKIRWANNFRDSFRVIKNSLIETNNNLEASNLHKLELYAKEIELKNKILNNPDNLQNNIEYWQLGIYKNTSEHHTSLVTILNFTMAIIGLWGLMLCGISYTFDTLLNFKFKICSLSIDTNVITFFLIICIVIHFIKYINNKLMIVIILFALIAIFAFIYYYTFTGVSISILFILIYMFVLSEFYIFFIKHNNISKNKNYTILFSFPLFILVLISNPHIIIPLDKFSQNSSNKCLETKLSQANKTEIINLASTINPEFNATKNPNLSENLSISELNEYKKFIVENKDKIYDTLSEFNKKKENKNNKKFENFEKAIYADSSRDKTIKCISFIYAIILGLCLFSLQKTARRNSVVPS